MVELLSRGVTLGEERAKRHPQRRPGAKAATAAKSLLQLNFSEKPRDLSQFYE